MGYFHSERRSRPFVVIFQSEMEVIAGMAVAAGAIETGGDLYGLFSHARRPVIQLATPAGPKAVHEYAHFRQDTEYTQRLSTYLRSVYATQYFGNHHSHHILGIQGLSEGDIRSTHSIAHKNGYRNMCQLLVTFAGHSSLSQHSCVEDGHCIQGCARQRWARWPWRRGDFEGDFRIDTTPTVHAFFYQNATYGSPISCPIKVIPGESPIRAALRSSNPALNVESHYRCPLSRIQFDNWDDRAKSQGRETDMNTDEPQFLDHIRSQVKYLPSEVRDNINVKEVDDQAIIRIPLRNYYLLLSMSTKIPYEIINVMIFSMNNPEEMIETTDHTIQKWCKSSMSNIYLSSIKLINNRFKNCENKSNTQDEEGTEVQNGVEQSNERGNCHVESIAEGQA